MSTVSLAISLSFLTLSSFERVPPSVFAALLTVDWIKISGSIECAFTILENKIIRNEIMLNIFLKTFLLFFIDFFIFL